MLQLRKLGPGIPSVRKIPDSHGSGGGFCRWQMFRHLQTSIVECENVI